MSEQERSWSEVRIGITPEEALQFLDDLASSDALRRRVEENPRQVLAEIGIELPEEAPDSVALPPSETIQYHADSLRTREPFGHADFLPHGFAVLFVAYGNGSVPPWPPPHDPS